MALFTFLMFGTSTFFLGLPFLVLAVWLLYRSYKVQKEATAKLRAAERAEASASTADDGGPAGRDLRARRPTGSPQEGTGHARGQQALHARSVLRRRRPSLHAGSGRPGRLPPTDRRSRPAFGADGR